MSGKFVWDAQIQKDKDKHLEAQKEKKLREQLARQEEKEREKMRKRKEMAKRKKEEILAHRLRMSKIKRRNKIIITCSIIIIIFLIVTFPFIPLENVSIANSNYYDKEQLVINKKKYNLIDIFKVDIMIPKNNNLIMNDNVDINFKEKNVTFNVTERSILGYNQSGELLYESNNMIYKIESDIKAPLIIGLSEEEQINAAKELKEIDYNIFNQIVTIQKDPNTDSDVVTMYMEDGNIIYVEISDIAEKIKYYNQIKSIIDAKGSGPGYIHLDIGDYYEPK